MDDSLISKLKSMIEKREYHNIQHKQMIIQKEYYKYYLTINNLLDVNNLNLYDDMIKKTSEKIKKYQNGIKKLSKDYNNNYYFKIFDLYYSNQFKFNLLDEYYKQVGRRQCIFNIDNIDIIETLEKSLIEISNNEYKEEFKEIMREKFNILNQKIDNYNNDYLNLLLQNN